MQVISIIEVSYQQNISFLSAKYQLFIRSFSLQAAILTASHTEDHRGAAARDAARAARRATVRAADRSMKTKTRIKAGVGVINQRK
jgi:hypothetical protein